MKVKLILPALLEATDPGFRPIKYALFPPLGLAALAGYLSPDDEAVLEDEHVMPLTLDDTPDLVVMSVYITSAKRAYEIADLYRRRGSHVALGGLHVSSLPDEAAAHADTVFIGPGEDTWPTFLADLRRGAPASRYVSKTRSLAEAPPLRRDLIDRRRYLCPNSIVVSRGCPHHCDFCYKDAFYAGGISFYTQAVDQALAEIDRMPGRHVYFLDDHLLGNPRFATALFEGMRGMGRVFQGASTVDAVLRPGLLELAAEAGMRSVFVGLETINPANLALHAKRQNVARDYGDAIRRIHGLGIMVNGSFVFGLDDDRPDVFDRTVDWAVSQGIETATFHIMTPYPGTALHDRISAEGRITDTDWDHYDTRHVVYRPRHLTPDAAAHRLSPCLPRVLLLVLDPARRLSPGDRPPAPPPPRLRRRLEAVRAVLGRRHPLAEGEPDAAAARGHARRLRARARPRPCAPGARGRTRGAAAQPVS